MRVRMRMRLRCVDPIHLHALRLSAQRMQPGLHARTRLVTDPACGSCDVDVPCAAGTGVGAGTEPGPVSRGGARVPRQRAADAGRQPFGNVTHTGSRQRVRRGDRKQRCGA